MREQNNIPIAIFGGCVVLTAGMLCQFAAQAALAKYMLPTPPAPAPQAVVHSTHDPLRVMAHPGVTGVQWSPDSRHVVSWGPDGAIKMWEAPAPPPPPPPAPQPLPLPLLGCGPDPLPVPETPSWSPAQATGEPDTKNDGDYSTAWAPAEQDDGVQWIELTYAARAADRVRIHETYNPGAVVRLILFDEQGSVISEIPVNDTTRKAPGYLEVTFPLTKKPVAAVRVVLDTLKITGWNEIDAVELVGPAGRGWAISAHASSYYTSEHKDLVAKKK